MGAAGEGGAGRTLRADRAGHDWRRRVRDPRETLDAMTFCRSGTIDPEASACAAATVMIELQVILHIWPARLDAVLRPSLRWIG